VADVATLADIGIDKIANAQQLALIRLHTKFTGDTHRLLIEYLDKLRAKIFAVAGEGGDLEPIDGFALARYATDEWAPTFNAWSERFEAARRQAVWIPFGQLARLHGHYMGLTRLTESRRWSEDGPVEIGIGAPDQVVFERYLPVMEAMRDRVDAILNDTAMLVYSDGKNLSQRIWELDHSSLTGIVRALQDSAATGDSAWNAAKRLEQHLGAGQECPRWTHERLYGLTKTEIAAGDEMGLIRGNPCESKGVAYNALRLARNEIQIAHHMATDRLFAAMPWVEAEQVVLSPSHPPIKCACPDIAAGGKKGDGVYPKGQVLLPIHVQCLCFKVAVLMDDKEFISKLRGWMTGQASWPGMDAYAEWLGVELPKPAVDERGFPLALDALEQVRSLGGSTGATLVRDPNTGDLYVMKRGGSPDHLREEALADSLYQALGLRVPEFKVFEEGDRPVKLARFIEGEDLASVLRGRNTRLKNKVLRQLREGFGVDALLANWDVAGLDLDNILVDKDGNVWRIDNGGSLRYRAQGRNKGADWNGYPLELWTMRDAGVNAQTARIFGDLEFSEIVTQLGRINRKRKALLDLLPDDLRHTVAQRLDVMRDVARTAKTMNADRWKWSYIDGFTRHSVGLRHAGIVDAFPQQLKHRGVQIRDENDLAWDHLRGRDSVMHDLSTYMSRNKGDYGVISYWMGRQAGSSWSGASQAVKWYLVQQRDIAAGEHFWLNGDAGAKKHYDGAVAKLGQQRYDGSMQMWHAFNYELMRNVSFERNNLRKGYVELVRTSMGTTSSGATRRQ
jgi:hypothetical protein